jgi:type III secretory pathway component EscV
MMNYKFLFVLGIIVLLTPFLGIPSGFKNAILLIIAILLIVYALLLRAASKSTNGNNQSHEDSAFVDSRFGKKIHSQTSDEDGMGQEEPDEEKNEEKDES